MTLPNYRMGRPASTTGPWAPALVATTPPLAMDASAGSAAAAAAPPPDHADHKPVVLGGAAAVANAASKTQVFTIATHDGPFHADEALAIWMLTRLPEYSKANIVRTRAPKKWAECQMLVDVGGVYDAAKHRYDHHQGDFKLKFREETKFSFRKPCCTRLSSAGLIYKHFGMELLHLLCAEHSFKQRALRVGVNLADPARLERLYEDLYDKFIHSIDAVDNGVSEYVDAGEPRFEVHTSLNKRIANLNKPENYDEYSFGDDGKFIPFDEMGAFHKAMSVMGEEFMVLLHKIVLQSFPARDIVLTALLKRELVHKSGQILMLDRPLGWKSSIYELERELGIAPVKVQMFGAPQKHILYVVMPKTKDPNSVWMVGCVPEHAASMQSRQPLPLSWRALKSPLDTLRAINQTITSNGNPAVKQVITEAQVSVDVWVHNSGFMGGSITQAGALVMAIAALESGPVVNLSVEPVDKQIFTEDKVPTVGGSTATDPSATPTATPTVCWPSNFTAQLATDCISFEPMFFPGKKPAWFKTGLPYDPKYDRKDAESMQVDANSRATNTTSASAIASASASAGGTTTTVTK